jgi:hypothetical protein
MHELLHADIPAVADRRLGSERTTSLMQSNKKNRKSNTAGVFGPIGILRINVLR